jgi:hypothetical protein
MIDKDHWLVIIFLILTVISSVIIIHALSKVVVSASSSVGYNYDAGVTIIP